MPSENRFGDAQVRQMLADMMRAFSSSDAVVHTVDLSGLQARGDARSATAEPAFRSGRESLSQIASLSGGRLFKDTNDVGAVFRELVRGEPALLPARVRAARARRGPAASTSSR